MVPQKRMESARRVLEEFGDDEEQIIDIEIAKKLLYTLKAELNVENKTEMECVECCVCLETQTPDGIRILKKCSHCFCATCLQEIIKHSSAKCPLCRVHFCHSDIYSMNALEEKQDIIEEKENVPMEQPEKAYIPAKVQALLHTLKADIGQNPLEKLISTKSSIITSSVR